MPGRPSNLSSASKVVVALLVGGLLATACSKSSSSSGTTSSTQLPDLHALLLTATDMLSSGWTVDTSSSNGGITGCTLPNTHSNTLEKAEVALQASGGFPEWDEQLADEPAGQAASDLSAGISSLDKCSSIQITGSGSPVSATIAPLSSAPQVGSGSAAWTISASVQGQAVTIFLEATVFGSDGAFFLYGELGTSESDFDSLVQKAADKINGTSGPTGSPTGTTGSTTTSSTPVTGSPTGSPTGTTGSTTTSTAGGTGTPST